MLRIKNKIILLETNAKKKFIRKKHKIQEFIRNFENIF